MNVFKENILDGMIYSFHFQRFPTVATHSMLTQIIGSEACSLEYVEQLYRRIDEKKFSLEKPHLLDFPDHVLEKVVKELEAESITVVRKTCKKLRALADNHPRRWEYLGIHFNVKNVSLHSNKTAVYYSEKEGGCLVKFFDNFCSQKIFLKSLKFVEQEPKQLLTQDLKTILLNPKLEIEVLDISKENETSFYPEFKQFFEMLSTLDHKLHVENFDWVVDFNTDDLRNIFESMKPGTLKTIRSVTNRISDQCSHLEKKVFNLPQWKEAKTLYGEFTMNWKDCIHLTRFDKVIMKKKSHSGRDKITGKIIMAVKDKLLENENLNQVLIENDDFLNSVKKLRSILLPFQSPTNRYWAEFNYPNSDKKLMIRVYWDTVWFKGPCFKPNEENTGLVMRQLKNDDPDDYEEFEPDVEDTDEELTDEEETDEEEIDQEVSDEELTDGGETDVEDPDAEP